MDKVLPTPSQQKMLCEIMHRAFVDLRILGWSSQTKQSADLADAFHNLPNEMHGVGQFSWKLTRGMLEEYQKKWYSQNSPGTCYDYVAMLDEVERAGQSPHSSESPQ